MVYRGMVGDDTCSTISSTLLSEFGGDGSSGEEEVDVPEMKYMPLQVKMEMGEVEEDGNCEDEEKLVKSRGKSKKEPPQVVRRNTPLRKDGPGDKMSKKEKEAEEKRKKRAMMTSEEKVKR